LAIFFFDDSTGLERGRKMKASMRILLILVLISIPALERGAQLEPAQDSSCALVREALNDYQHIRVGITRNEVERYFKRDGGMQFPDNTRYVYSKCPYLHLDVEFQAKGSTEPPFSGEDTVIKTSKLYVDYSVKD
jgi:hypothetical protein